MLCYPISFRGQSRGVIEAFTFEPHNFSQAERETFRRLAHMAGVTIEHAAHSRESYEFADVARALSAAPDFDRAMQVIIESARKITNASSSTIVLFDERKNIFSIGSHTPPDGQPPTLYTSEGGLTTEIIENGEPVKD